MKRTFAYVSAALTFCLMMLALSLPATTRTVKAADINEKCNDCLARTAAHYNQCVATFGELDPRCGEHFNQDIIHCYRNFCEQ
jgi:uncharacterized membrane protein